MEQNKMSADEVLSKHSGLNPESVVVISISNNQAKCDISKVCISSLLLMQKCLDHQVDIVFKEAIENRYE